MAKKKKRRYLTVEQAPPCQHNTSRSPVVECPYASDVYDEVKTCRCCAECLQSCTDSI